MLVYLMDIQIYDQVSIPRSWSKPKLHRAVLWVWLKGDENNSEHHESWHALLSSKCTSKSIIKFGVTRGENS